MHTLVLEIPAGTADRTEERLVRVGGKLDELRVGYSPCSGIFYIVIASVNVDYHGMLVEFAECLWAEEEVTQ